MAGAWLASYLVLWILVLGLSLLVIGLLQQLGVVQRQLLSFTASTGTAEASVPKPEEDGPSFASALSELEVETINGFGILSLEKLSTKGSVMLVFMSPMCESCQSIVEPLNELVKVNIQAVNIAVIMRSDEQACRAFLNIFPLHLPVICDSSRDITRSFNVHSSPFGLWYDAAGSLRRKSLLRGREELLTLLGDGSAPLEVSSTS